MEPVYIVAGVRTAIGSFGGSLKDHAPADLGAAVIGEAVRRAGLTPDDIGHVVMGQVIQTAPKDAYLARVAALKAGLPVAAPALTLNRLCGSGLEAIVTAARMIALDEVEIAAAGGAEVMSRAPHHVAAARFGQKMGPVTLADALIEVLSDPIDGYHMGITAENVARDHHDEHIRGDSDMAGMAALRPAFQKGGTVTAGNASGINDGAAAVVLASAQAVAARGLTPMGRILGWGHAGVEPSHMGLGPIGAVPIALARAGLSLDEIDVIESNEAFAAQACAVARTLGFDPAKVNPNGSGISLGHPVGATGAILTVKALYELDRIGGRYALATMCIGGGQGIAMVVERQIAHDGRSSEASAPLPIK